MVALTALTKLVVIPGICQVGCLKDFVITRIQFSSVVEKALKLSKVEGNYKIPKNDSFHWGSYNCF